MIKYVGASPLVRWHHYTFDIARRRAYVITRRQRHEPDDWDDQQHVPNKRCPADPDRHRGFYFFWWGRTRLRMVKRGSLQRALTGNSDFLDRVVRRGQINVETSNPRRHRGDTSSSRRGYRRRLWRKGWCTR